MEEEEFTSVAVPVAQLLLIHACMQSVLLRCFFMAYFTTKFRLNDSAHAKNTFDSWQAG